MALEMECAALADRLIQVHVWVELSTVPLVTDSSPHTIGSGDKGSGG